MPTEGVGGWQTGDTPLATFDMANGTYTYRGQSYFALWGTAVGGTCTRSGTSGVDGRCGAEVSADRGPGVGDGVVGPQVNLLILDRSPEPLDEDTASSAAWAVHLSR